MYHLKFHRNTSVHFLLWYHGQSGLSTIKFPLTKVPDIHIMKRLRTFQGAGILEYFVTIMEIIGTVAFAISGAMLALKKDMDLFGVCIMGLTTACGGGVIRDVLLGYLPPAMFRQPVYALTAIGVSLVIFLPAVRRIFAAKERAYEVTMLLADSVGLGIFTSAGVAAAVGAGYGKSFFFSVFLGAITGVGGGVLRDVMAGMRPYIFVKHIYACASLAGAVVCALLWNSIGKTAAMLLGCAVIFVIRLLAAHFRWSLPKANI
jgi:uncharacterized membrane protein YeiH